MGKRRVEMNFLNWDAECYHDLATGNGFLITDPPTLEFEGGKTRAMFGPQSPIYGTSISDDQELSTRYRCKCGEFTGKVFRGHKCPKCNTVVEFKDVKPEVTGWIPLGPNKIINPLFYRMLGSAVGEEDFKDIVVCQQTVNRDGVRSPLTDEDREYLNTSNPFYGIGLEEFRIRYYDVLDWVEKKKPAKKEMVNLLRNNSVKVFTSYVPVYTPLLRQASVSGDSYYYTGIDRHINPLINLSRELDSCTDIDLAMILNRIQSRTNAMWEINFSELDKKDGFIRDQISGGSINYSSRDVIIPDPTLRDNEVDLSYAAAHMLFRFPIIHNLMVTNGITLAEANAIWEKGFIYDERIFKVILYILEREKPMLIVNRNPTLNFYSILLMKIRNIISDKKSYVMSVPLSILPGLNADFDGDILNIIGLMDPAVKKMFRKFDPIHSMITNRDDGFLNDYFGVTKGQKIDLYNFCTC